MVQRLLREGLLIAYPPCLFRWEIIVWTALLYDPHPRGARLQRLRGQVRQRREIDITIQANIRLNTKKPDDFELHQALLLYL